MPEQLTNHPSGSVLKSKVTFIHWTSPNLGHSLMTKCLYGLNFFSVSNWTPSLRVKEFIPSLQKPQAHGKLRLLLVERNNIKMGEISLNACACQGDCEIP